LLSSGICGIFNQYLIGGKMTKKKFANLTKTEALILAWKQRKDYLGLDKKSSLHTSWRARIFTKKGKESGFPESWSTFKGFKKDIPDGWVEGKILVRKNPLLPFSKTNTEWLEKGLENLGKSIQLEYNGITKTIIEWCNEYKLNWHTVRNRYYKKEKNYTNKEILFAREKIKRTITDYKLLSELKIRNKISKMLSSYKHKDMVNNKTFNLTFDFFKNNIISMPCSYCGSTENIGCDRINNNLGHTIENVIPACHICNTARNNHFSVNEMKEIGKVINLINTQHRIS
jgi:hypothetical protein